MMCMPLLELGLEQDKINTDFFPDFFFKWGRDCRCHCVKDECELFNAAVVGYEVWPSCPAPVQGTIYS